MPTIFNTTTTSAELAVHPDHDRGLEFDVRTLMARRSALGLLSGAGSLAPSGVPTVRPARRRRPPGRPRPPHRRRRARAAGATAFANAVTTRVPDETASPTPVTAATGRTHPRRPYRAPGHHLVVRHVDDDGERSATHPELTVLDSSSGFAAMPVSRSTHGTRMRRPVPMYSRVEDDYLRGVQPADDAGYGELHHGLPRLLRRPVAARPLRGLPQHRRGHE